MKSCTKALLLIAGLGLILLVGCSKNSSGPAAPTDAQGWINLAWAQYQSWDYNNSQASFGSAFQLAAADSSSAYQDSVNAMNSNPPDTVAKNAAVARLVVARDQLVQIFTGGGWLGTRFGYISRLGR